MSFDDLVDLASDAVGGAAIACNDEFFAEKEALLRPHAAEWKDHAYTDRGKWMDGWETRRRRAPEFIGHPSTEGDHDWCVVRLGMPGRIKGFVVDTAWFRGNFPESCRILAAEIDEPLDLRRIDSVEWTELVAKSPLQGDSKNKLEVHSDRRWTHVKLEIFPDGGVARLRVHGEVVPKTLEGKVDLAALDNGAVVETCSDMFFGSRNNLIKPGPSRSMADGWETRRRRGPGNDWALVRLAGAGTIDQLVIDTSHFKGNAPARVVVEGGNTGDGPWRELLSSPLQPHTVHVFEGELRRIGDASYLRVSVFPCGGIARLRAWGVLADQAERADKLTLMPVDAAYAAFLTCCGSTRWAREMSASRPYEDLAALLRIGERTWWGLAEADRLEAFAAHPKIGEKSDKAYSAQEQAGAANAGASVLDELASANHAYLEKFGFIFIVCATGRTAEQMLDGVKARLANAREDEVRIASEEQAKILRLRLTKLIGELT